MKVIVMMMKFRLLMVMHFSSIVKRCGALIRRVPKGSAWTLSTSLVNLNKLLTLGLNLSNF